MRIFISGGCKNGKSSLAERLAIAQRGDKPLYYIATMQAHDAEDEQRIASHRLSRQGLGFITIERGKDIAAILSSCDCFGSFLLDSLTALLSNEMFDDHGSFNPEAFEHVADGLTQLMASLPNLVIVSDFIYSDANVYNSLTEAYRRSLAKLDFLTAGTCESVLEVVYGSVVVHKGKVLQEGLKQ